MADYRSVISSFPEGKTFFVRHHSFVRSDILEKNWYSEYTDEMFDSLFDCLACYRWYVIPERLRDVSGLRDETDLELLLDRAGYSISLIAEELFCMIDTCLESGNCSEQDLHRIQLAYNGLSGFQDNFIRGIERWGLNRGNVPAVRNPIPEGFYKGYIQKLSAISSAASGIGVFAG